MKATLQDVRDNIEKFHDEWFAIVEKMCDSVQCSAQESGSGG